MRNHDVVQGVGEGNLEYRTRKGDSDRDGNPTFYSLSHTKKWIRFEVIMKDYINGERCLPTFSKQSPVHLFMNFILLDTTPKFAPKGMVL